jgi:hypothetical protein
MCSSILTDFRCRSNNHRQVPISCTEILSLQATSESKTNTHRFFYTCVADKFLCAFFFQWFNGLLFRFLDRDSFRGAVIKIVLRMTVERRSAEVPQGWRELGTFKIFIIIIIVISFMQGIHTYIPETNHVSRVYSVVAILRVLLMVHVTLSSILNPFVLLH